MSGKGKNLLQYETSPYLVQHASNPIWWYPWGDKAFEAAKKHNKPIFLSIGYSTCYWCHFMEEDSFEKEDVAAILNKHFIAIKVDREERPDVDEIYMNALVAMKGNGGWPISMFLTPDGQPFFGESTIPHDAFIEVLTKIADEWGSNQDGILETGKSVSDWLVNYLNKSLTESDIQPSVFGAFVQSVTSVSDPVYYGLGQQQKFPQSQVAAALMRIYRRSGDESTLQLVTSTLDAMAKGGLHDWLAGGFHRYCVDKEWKVPHFEKMLYDNSGLLLNYLEGYQLTQNESYRDVSKQILNWVISEMSHSEGGFYSAVDAGRFEEEGDYYVWTYSELDELLSESELTFLSSYFDISKSGNFEDDKIVLNLLKPDQLTVLKDSEFSRIRDILIKARQKREYPHLDDKILVGWNGRMVAAFCKAYQVLGNPEYLQHSQQTMHFIKDKLWSTDGLARSWRQGKVFGRAVLNDYAFLIEGLLALYQSDFDIQWLEWAIDLQERQDKLFWDEDSGGYYLNDGVDTHILARSKVFGDSAMPSGNGMSAYNLLRLADYTGNMKYKDNAEQLFRLIANSLKDGNYQYAQFVVALDYYFDRAKEIGIVGDRSSDEVQDVLKQLYSQFLPNMVLAVSQSPSQSSIPFLKDKSGDTVGMVYVCESGACQLPTTNVESVVDQASSYRVISP